MRGMQKHVIRPAEPSDIQDMVQLHKEYRLQTYQGFPALQNQKEADCWGKNIQEWLQTPQMRVLVLLLDGAMRAITAYRLQEAEAGMQKSEGEIVNLEILPGTPTQFSGALVSYILKDLAGMGSKKVRVWLLRDNLRSRYGYEQLGFKADGSICQVTTCGEDFCMTRYVYQIPDKVG